MDTKNGVEKLMNKQQESEEEDAGGSHESSEGQGSSSENLNGAERPTILTVRNNEIRLKYSKWRTMLDQQSSKHCILST